MLLPTVENIHVTRRLSQKSPKSFDHVLELKQDNGEAIIRHANAEQSNIKQ